MKKTSYILSMVGYGLVFIIDTFSYFFGYSSLVDMSFRDWIDFAFFVVLFDAVLMIFASLSYFKSDKFIYILRTFLFINIFRSVVASLGYFHSLAVTIPISIFSILLLILTFIEKEKAVTREEKKDKMIVNVLFFTIVPIVILYCIEMIMIPMGIVSEIAYKNDYYKEHSYTTEKATKEESENIFNEITKGNYSYLKPYWYMTDLDSRTTAKLRDFDFENEYWIVDNNQQIIMKTEYDSWDNLVSKDLKIKNDFAYPNTHEDEVANVYLYYGDNIDTLEITAKLQLNDSQIKELHDVTFFGVPKENSDKLVNKKETGLQTISEYYIFWEFESAEKLVFQRGALFEIADGKYILNYENADGNHYIISDEMNEIIDKAVSVYKYD